MMRKTLSMMQTVPAVISTAYDLDSRAFADDSLVQMTLRMSEMA